MHLILGQFLIQTQSQDPGRQHQTCCFYVIQGYIIYRQENPSRISWESFPEIFKNAPKPRDDIMIKTTSFLLSVKNYNNSTSRKNLCVSKQIYAQNQKMLFGCKKTNMYQNAKILPLQNIQFLDSLRKYNILLGESSILTLTST